MHKKLAKLRYLPNNFEIVEEGDHVVCAVSGKKINLNNLNYWNVDLQEAYFSFKEAHLKNEEIKKKIVIISTYHETKSIGQVFLISFFLILG